MKRNLFLLVAALVVCSNTAFGWGRSGHDAIAYIAECNLTPKAKKNIEKYLGHSIVYDASWMDCYRHTPAYKHTTVWHTQNVDEQGRYTPRKGGDAVECIEDAIAKLQDYRSQSDSTVVMALRCLIHFVGDMHCPSHVKYPGAKNYKFYNGDTPYEFHSFWDSGALDMNHRWGYIEYGHQLDRLSKKQKRAISAGTPRDWVAESARDCRVVYEWTTPEQRFSKNQFRDMLNVAHPFAEAQLQKAGYRLASLLNELLG